MPGATGALAVVFALLLAGCGGEASPPDERRFANEEPPTVDPSLQPTATVTRPPATSPAGVAAAPAVSPEALLVARGAPRRLYFLQGQDLWTAAPDGTDARRLLSGGGEGTAVRAFAAAPNGARVAALVVGPAEGDAPEKGEAATLVVLEASGNEVRRVEDIQAATGVASARAVSLDWSPQGDHLLVTFAGGGLVDVPSDGAPRLLVDAARAPLPEDAAWSPAGDAVAYTSRGDPAAALTLFVAPAGGGEPVAVAPGDDRPGRAVASFAWLPDGSGLLYVGGPAGEPSRASELYRVATDGTGRSLVATAQEAAPVAGISEMVPSPDGRAVAFAVVRPGDQGPVFDGVWVQPLAGGRAAELPLPGGASASDLVWTSLGLVWRSTPDSGGTPVAAEDDAPFALLRIDTAGLPIEIYRGVPAAAGTPGASPAAGSGGTPSPVASPDSSTPPAPPEPSAPQG